ncbi:glycosyltransferase family 39 protein [candidate division WOR-3 bacterium]|nr:glycosyltransferase family 39 protein [candidate division WOR-3 bacterium]
MIVISIITFTARVFYVLKIGEITSSEDFRIAINISEGNGFIFNQDVGPTALKAPLYPYFLSLIMILFGSKALLSAVLIQHVIFSLTPFIIYKSGELLENKKFGFVCATVFALYPAFISYPNTIEVASISIPFGVLTLYLILLSVKRKPKVVILSVLCSALLCLLQPMFFIILILLYTFLLIKRKTKLEFWAFMIFLLTVSPWVIRNYVTFNKFIFIKSPFWQNVYTGYMPDYHRKEEFDIVPDSVKKNIDEDRKIYNDVEMEERYKNAVLPIIRSNIGLYIKKSFSQLFWLWWSPPKYSGNISFAVFRMFPLSLIYIFSIFGLKRIFSKENRKFYTAILFTMVYFSVVYALTFALNVRFKLEFEWLLFFVAAQGFILLQRLSRPEKDSKSHCQVQSQLSESRRP